MTLLDLPTELFEAVMRSLAASCSVEKTVPFRLVCKTFDRAIVTELAKSAARLSFSRMYRHTGYHAVFKTQGEHILKVRLLTAGRRKHIFVAFLQEIISQQLTEEWLDASTHDNVRIDYTSKIVRSLIALDPAVLREYLTRRDSYLIHTAKMTGRPLPKEIMPAIAAALGKTHEILRHVVQPADLLDSDYPFFPNTLDAAVASGNTESLCLVLEYLAKHVKGKPEASSWDAMRTAARGVGKALRVAIRLHQNDAAKVIFD